MKPLDMVGVGGEGVTKIKTVKQNKRCIKTVNEDYL